MNRIVFILLSFFISKAAIADEMVFSEISPYYFNARSLGMGGAHLGLSEDQNALFQNPAGLGQDEDAEIHLLPISIEGSTDGYDAYTESTGSVSQFSLELLDSLAGKNVYARGMLAPVVRAPGFAFGFIWDEQLAIYNKNRALPDLSLGVQSTRLMQIGYGLTLMGSKRSKKTSELKVGFGAKYFWRRGGVRKLSQTEVLSMSTDGQIKLATLVGEFHTGIDFDVGARYKTPITQDWSFGLGASWINIGDGLYLNSKKTAAPLEGNLGLGLALSYNSKYFDANFLYDVHYLQKTSMDFRKKNHLGLEIKFPVISFFAGLNQVYLSYGFGVNLWFFRLYGLTYTEELSSFTRQEPNKRYLVKLEFTFPF